MAAAHVLFIPGLCVRMYFIVNFLKIKVYTPYSSLKFFLEQFLGPGSQAAGQNLPEPASAQLPTFPSESLPFIAHPSTEP